MQLFIPKYSYFLFGMCDERGLPQYGDLIQEVGAEIVSISSGLAPMPQSHLTLHNGGKPQMMAVAKVYCRCLKEDFDRVMDRLKAKEEAEKRGAKK